MNSEATELAQHMFDNVFRRDAARDDLPPELTRPGRGYLGVREVFGAVLGRPDVHLIDLRSLSGDDRRLMALRYFVDNAHVWLKHYNWRPTVAPLWADSVDQSDELEALAKTVGKLREKAPALSPGALDSLASPDSVLMGDLSSEAVLETLVALALDSNAREELRSRIQAHAMERFESHPALLDRLYLASTELRRYPATTVKANSLRYVLVADKGEMGVRAVRETAALGLIPAVLHSLQDDETALQVRLADELGGFAIGLEGSFRESYASYEQISRRAIEAFQERFGDAWEEELSRAALYPGYGPLAENTAAIRCFRRNGIVFAGPMEDVVQEVGDKRQFRQIVESIDAKAVTPGIVIAETDAQTIRERVLEAHSRGDFRFPGRLKAANGGGGRGQAIVENVDALDGAIDKVLGEIDANAWDPGVMFEQNIQRTVHLEVQVLRDRYGNTRHFGMRDCTEQRASQKIQEEAPPRILRERTELEARVQRIAVQIADRVGYVGAGTVELMFADGEVYFLEMNTRIQVEHPVTEASHAIRRGDGLEPLNLVQWQIRIANGAPVDFAQSDVVQTHVARELRINAESWRPTIKDPRDRKTGLFVPNGGIFDRIDLPDPAALTESLAAEGVEDLRIRFDVGFEVGDSLINKDPTFGKLIVAVKAKGDGEDYERLRVAILAVLENVHIEGRQLRPDGRVLEDRAFETNLDAHRWVLKHDMMKRHAAGQAEGRHVGWVVDALREEANE